MKKMVMLLVMMVGRICAAGDADLALWGITTDGAGDQAAARLGAVIPVSDTNSAMEVGGTVRWDFKDPWNEDVDYAGAYLLFFPDLMVDVFDPSPNNIFGDFLGMLNARPYFGIEGLIPTHGRNRSVDVNWIAGTLIGLDPNMQAALMLELVTGQTINEDNSNLLMIGARVRF